jgi:hypothetical protein
VGDGEKLLTYLNLALKVLSGLDIRHTNYRKENAISHSEHNKEIIGRQKVQENQTIHSLTPDQVRPQTNVTSHKFAFWKLICARK